MDSIQIRKSQESQEKMVEFVCLNEFCSEFRLSCFKSIQKGCHLSHQKDLRQIAEVFIYLSNQLNICDQLLNQLINLNKSMHQIFDKFQKNFNKSSLIDVEQLKKTNSQFNDTFFNLIELKIGQNTLISTITQNREALMKSMQIGFINQQKSGQQNLIKIQDYSQSLKFSTMYKHNNCQVSYDGKVIETKNGGWQCCMCDQIIPKDYKIQFAIKIIEMGYIMIGIGVRDIVQSQGFRNCYEIGGGTYNIQYSGSCWNHDQQDKQGQQISFPFSINDIIIVEVDIQNKYVKWNKQSTNQSFTLTIDTSNDLYPCVHLFNQSKVEILNEIFQ
ncbi:unnamed protein product [Paramecium sonneborni]|uniref:SPRY domain-containing protein n=1 Tax=Paramecium sonneborni TaxID=65129 RepID=A0A8S1LCE2_9CILI|nr:unnamed protein product [Paramecium sonneborni]